ncbi:MAG: c-type cytochrome [Paracoccaceae bacterium]
MTRLASLLALALLAGCDQPEMARQPKYEPYETAPGFADGHASLTPPEGALPTTALVADRPPMPEVTMALLEDGRRVYTRLCTPCHGRLGDGQGMVPRRGYPHPPSFHTARLRGVSDAHVYDVVTNGWGVMYPYANRVLPHERWAVAAYIRALQLARHAFVERLPAEMRDAVATAARTPAAEPGPDRAPSAQRVMQ